MDTRSRHRAAQGFSMVEATLAVIVVGVMFVAALSTLSASRLSQKLLSDRAVAKQLAMGLVTEMQSLSYQDPDAASVFGNEAGEAALPGRSGYDDIDDYDGLNDQPISDRQGNPLGAPGGWMRTVTVQRVSPADLKTVVGTESGFYRVTVRVMEGQRELAELTFLSTAAE